MDADVSATGLDVSLEIVLLRGVEYVAGGVQENDGAVSRKILLGKRRGVLGRVDGEPVLLSEPLNGGESDSDGAMSESGRFGEDEYAWLLGVRGNGDAERGEKRERSESLHGRSEAMVMTS